MAEDQDKQKPKATLIKKKPELPADTAASEISSASEKKKVRVVVKRKPKVTTAARPDLESPEADAPAKTASKSSPATQDSRKIEHVPESRVDEAPQKPAAPAETHADSAPSHAAAAPDTAPDTAPAKKAVPQEKAPPPEPRRTAEKAAPTSAPEEKRAASGSGPGLAWSNAKPTGQGRINTPEHKRPPLPSSIRGRGAPPPPRGETGRSEGFRGEGVRGGSAPPPRGSADGFRRSAPGGPGTPPGRSGPPQGRGPVGARPGGPPRGPAGARPGMGRPPAPGRPAPTTSGDSQDTDKRGTPQKGPGKRFFKSRKGKGGYERDDRQREKEISFNRKKSQPKANPVPKEIDIMEVVTVSELARKMNLKANELIGKLMSMGMMVTINQQIDRETAEILAGEYGCKVNVVSLYDETLIETAADHEDDLQTRPPIVTVMGHVDHGKTKLLDAIRTTNVVDDEHGGITQHIGAYQVVLEQGTLTFLDTPGHEAFTLMRARGAQVTDIVVLVVAANDGVMPQTKEAISHAKEADVPIIVAINKVDLPEANIDRVKQQLSELELIPDDWGGQTPMVEVSALKKEGIEDLLETIVLQAELLELRANFDRRAEGKVIESRIDPGRGIVASVLIERGTLRIGDSFIAGIFPGKVRAMFNDRGKRVEEAQPSTPVEILGFDGVPDSGDPFQVTEDEKSARQVGSKRQELKRVEVAKNVKKVTLDNLYDSIQDGAIQELKVVIKGDVHGSVEALQSALEKLSTKEVRLVAIHSSAGAINEGDVMLASASNALVIGFHVRPTPRAQQLAEREKVEIKKYSIIYDAVEDVRAAMEGMLAPDLQEQTVGAVEVREVFKVPKVGVVAGCYVTEGKVQRKANVRVFRDNLQIHEGTISSLKRFKDDAREVDAGYECGIGISNLQDVQVGDTLEIYVIKEVAKKLGS